MSDWSFQEAIAFATGLFCGMAIGALAAVWLCLAIQGVI